MSPLGFCVWCKTQEFTSEGLTVLTADGPDEGNVDWPTQQGNVYEATEAA